MAQALVSGLSGLWTLAQALLFFMFLYMDWFSQGSLNGPAAIKSRI